MQKVNMSRTESPSCGQAGEPAPAQKQTQRHQLLLLLLAGALLGRRGGPQRLDAPCRAAAPPPARCPVGRRSSSSPAARRAQRRPAGSCKHGAQQVSRARTCGGQRWLARRTRTLAITWRGSHAQRKLPSLVLRERTSTRTALLHRNTVPSSSDMLACRARPGAAPQTPQSAQTRGTGRPWASPAGPTEPAPRWGATQHDGSAGALRWQPSLEHKAMSCRAEGPGALTAEAHVDSLLQPRHVAGVQARGQALAPLAAAPPRPPRNLLEHADADRGTLAGSCTAREARGW